MGLLSRDAILSSNDLTFEEVDVPEWGGMVRVRTLTGEERDALESSMVERHGRKVDVNLSNLRARLVSLSCVDANGDRLFSDLDIEALGQKSAAALERVFAVARKLSGLSEQDVDELTKN